MAYGRKPFRKGQKSYGERRPQREGAAPRREGYAPRREGSFAPRREGYGDRRPAPRAGYGERREGFAPRREGGFAKRPMNPNFAPRPEGFDKRPPRREYAKRREAFETGREDRYSPKGFDRGRFLQKAKAGVQKAYTKPDAPLVQATRAIDDLDQSKSLLYQRLCEWVQINFPEMDLKNEETVCMLYAEFGDRKLFDDDKVFQMMGSERGKEILALAKKSFGGDFSDEDRKAVSTLAARVLELFKARTELQAYVEGKARKEMPNVCELVDPLLAARLLSLAGNLKNLSEMPASTVQVIGAENALFKHLKDKRRVSPPKHGIIFQSPLINGAPFSQRGKIARALATKLSIAARADYYTKRDISPKLKADLEKRLKEIREGDKAE